jgi:hypothetical protein
MNGEREMARVLCSAVCLVVLATCATGLSQQAPVEKPNELVVGKQIYVAEMPDGLDQWIIDFLRRWGKYKITGNPEGVDLVIQATDPDQELQLETRAGTAQPKGADRPHLPHSKAKSDEPLPTSISVINWVTSQPVWQADILNRKPKKDEAAAPAGPHTKIFARAMTSDQLAQQVVAKLKEYEEGLEKSAPGKN